MPRTKKAASKSAAANSTSSLRSRQRAHQAAETSSNASDSEQPLQTSSPQVPSNVARKLVVFSIALLILPILVYFITLNSVFSGRTTPAAVAAAVTANLVLAGYVYAAWVEEDSADQLKHK